MGIGTSYGAPTDPPPPAVSIEAAAIVQQMKQLPRGPYSRLRWFCNDGTAHPPQAYACRERSGGRQHAEYSPERAHLAGLGFHVGTIFAALPWEEFYDPATRHRRMRELALERYLQDIDDGWVLRRAQFYRGRVQAEDEAAAGRALLLKLFADADWFRANFLLARELTRTVPHGEDTDLTRLVRRTAVELVALDASAEPLRLEIHGMPSPGTAERVRAWARNTAAPDAGEKALALADALDNLFGAGGRHDRIVNHVAALSRAGMRASWLDELPGATSLPILEQVPAVGRALASIRTAARDASTARIRLRLMTLLQEVEADLLTLHAALQPQERERGQLLMLAQALVSAGYGVGLVSPGEMLAVTEELSETGVRQDDASFLRAVQTLQRLPQWAAGSIRYTFAEPLVAYTALDSRAQRFVDDLLRNSPLLMLGDVLQPLAGEARTLTGVGTNLFDSNVPGVIGLNAGMATGPLRIFATLDELERATLQRSDIVVLPETTAELAPVAGILTLGEGSPLSHVQLLARNFGIPNVALAPGAVAHLRRHEGERVLFSVGSDGSVVLLPEAQAMSRAGLPEETLAADGTGQLTVPVPDLSVRAPIPLDQLHRGLSGRQVGPKAANLGELNRLFPGRVAQALALPFGAFATHTADGSPSIRDELRDTYARARQENWSDAQLNTALAAVRARIAALELQPATREAVTAMMAELFGPPGSYGVFVRSDTNVEDLPQFTGAGLSETVPNVVGLDAQLASVPRVWASVLSPRAIAWRSRLLSNPADVYASVLLMRSVPSTKSGVLITTNLIDRDRPGVTVATAWGVGGAVAGEAAETLVLEPDGSTYLVFEAKAPYQRRVAGTGGVDWVPASDGPVLTAPEMAALRSLTEEVAEKYTPVMDDEGRQRPWDIEFGFVEGELTLFQIRPLVERGQQRADRLVRLLVQPGEAR